MIRNNPEIEIIVLYLFEDVKDFNINPIQEALEGHKTLKLVEIYNDNTKDFNLDLIFKMLQNISIHKLVLNQAL